MPLLIAETGSTQAICSGFCAALETDNTPAHVNNGKGDPAVWAKLPHQAGLAQGNATCEVGKKGSEVTSVCRFFWVYAVDSNGNLPAAYLPYVDTLGVCFGRTHYRYDADNDGVLTAADPETPDCATLPPRSALTVGRYDDAADFFCQKYSSSMFTGPMSPLANLDAAVAPHDRAPIVRHELR
ncbi:MAG: hypothetical protein IPQ07_44875 [Myxococcales bacterium]|nr:hypothetical protein [Myxococcales bacterium]